MVSRIGSGSYGEIYEARDTVTQIHVAVKIERASVLRTRHHIEVQAYQILSLPNPVNGIPYLFNTGSWANRNIMVMELLGPSLSDLLTYCQGRFSVTTTCKLAVQMFPIVKFLHNHGLTHRDLKPANFVMGQKRSAGNVFIVDFGLCKEFTMLEDGNSTECAGRCVGTPRYCSVNSHRGRGDGRGDDLESLCYVLIYLCKGELPWQKSCIKGDTAKRNRSRTETNIAIEDLKRNIPPDELCHGLPPCFTQALIYAKELKNSVEPDYNALTDLFRDTHAELTRNSTYDKNFDWDTMYKERKYVINLGGKREG